MATRNFHRFGNLPTELRLQIWSYCIPGPRVVEMDFPVSIQHLTIPAGFPRALWSSPAGRVPLLSRVCREARSVVLNRVQYVTWTNALDNELADGDSTACPLEYWSDWGVDAPVRFREGIDIVHLNWHCGYERVDMLNDAQYPWETFQWLANHAAAASVSADLLLPFEPPRENPHTNQMPSLEREEMKYFSPRRVYYVVLTIVEIHISTEEAARAGIFGVLGEEPIRLVDPRDTLAVARFREVWSRHQTGVFQDQEPEVAEFFTTVIDNAETYLAHVEEWRQNLEKIWLWYKSIEPDVPQEVDEEIWPHWMNASHEATARLYRYQREINREHPWVQTQLPLMPRFVPAVMFRHCDSTSGSCQRHTHTFNL
ncbi:hypothetical protein N0V88_005965 [Collariella sp. IMI 366227]|nr:hypothetical protein N0V88_005965 [Collariella sp. IMI 366227]